MNKFTIAILVVSTASNVLAGFIGHIDSFDLGGHLGGEIADHFGGHFDNHHESFEHEGGEHEHPKDYNFDYTVHDPHTHDYHSHQESSHGGVVKGYYSVKEADGSLREVHYTADKHNGFKAIVTKNGVQIHPHTDGSPSHAEGSSAQSVHHL